MSRNKRRETLKMGTTLLLLLFVLSGFENVSTLPTPVVLAAIVPQRLVYNTFPVARDIPVLQVTLPVKVSPMIAEAHLIIPSIKVNAVIKEMGITLQGAMAVPGNRIDVGWYSLGTRPGLVGSAVIGGHNRWNDGVGVFDRLDQLKKGDLVSVVDAKGVTTTFVVRDMKTFEATDINSGIFASESGAHLNLITCSGSWDPAAKSYTTRLVIYTDLVVK